MPEHPSTMSRDHPMPGTVGTFRILGVPIRFHFTFLLLFVFLVVAGFSGEQSAAMTASYLLALFGSVLVHELGHAVVSRRFGIKTLEVVMFPIGGVARLERNPGARQELWVALAGPVVNLVIAGAIFAILFFRDGRLALEGLEQVRDSNLLQRIAVGNLVLAVFNLLPAYPMDGGRVLRSLLARMMAEQAATRIAARTGRLLAVAMGLYGLLVGQFMLVFVAFFVYLGATHEGEAAAGRSLTVGLPVRSAMVTDFRTLAHGDTLRDAAALLLATSQQDFPVMLGNSVTGLLSRAALLRGMASEGPDAYVASVMDRDFTRVAPDMDLAEALPAMAEAGSCALVMEGDQLLGLLTAENLSEFLLLRRVGLPETRTRG
jgi:Zn-dependent protease